MARLHAEIMENIYYDFDIIGDTSTVMEAYGRLLKDMSEREVDEFSLLKNNEIGFTAIKDSTVYKVAVDYDGVEDSVQDIFSTLNNISFL